MTVSPPQRRGAAAVQLLTPEGERVAHPEYDVDFRDQDYRDLYRDMALVRRVDIEATALQRQGELGLWASCLGQEAAQVGSARAMHSRDYAFPTYRDHGVTWCRGIDPSLLLGQFRGVELGGWDPQQHRCALYAIVIGSQTLHATGYAMGVAKDGALGDGRGGGHRLLRRRRLEPGRRQRDLHLRQRVPGPGGVLLPEQPVGDLRAQRAAEPGGALQRRSAGFGFPGFGSTATTCSPATRWPARRSTPPAPARGRPSSRRSRTGWALTRPPTTPPATGCRPSWSRGSSKIHSSG